MKYSGSISDRIKALRAEMRREKIDLYIIPSTDYHNSEYIGEYFKERQYMTGRQNSEKKKAPQLLSLHGLKNLRSLSSEITLFVIHLMQVWITLRETSIMQEKKHSARCS